MRGRCCQISCNLVKLYSYIQTSRCFSIVPSSPLLSPESLHVFPRNRRTQSHQLSQLLLSPPQGADPRLYNKIVHSKVILLGFESTIFLNNVLINAYSKSGCLDYARLVFDSMPQRNLITWASVISIYFHQGFYEEALLMFSEFCRCSDEGPNKFVLASVIHCCARLGSARRGAELHGSVLKNGFYHHVNVGTALVDFYSKCSDIGAARLVFDDLPAKNAATWTTIITAFARSGKSEVSLQLFFQMREIGIVPDKYAITCALTACSSLGYFEAGKQIHAYVLRWGEGMDASVSNALIDFYMKSGEVKNGWTLFDQLDTKNVISWTTIISGYMQNSFDWQAIEQFAKMNNLGWKPDGFTCCSVLISCGSCEALDQGRQVHAYTLKANLNTDDYVLSSLIGMYSKCYSLVDAQKAFDSMERSDVIAYNAMIEGYYRRDMLYEALDLFAEMRINSIHPSLLSFVTLLGVSASLLSLVLSRQLHGLVTKFGFSGELFAGSSIINAYSQCSSSVDDARRVFEEMDGEDIVVWNTMLFGYVQQSRNAEALRLFLELQYSSRLKPNAVTFIALLTGSGNLASLPHGLQFHSQIIKAGLDSDPFLGNALVDMYANCGSSGDALKAFESITHKDVACWNSMISTYAQHGEARDALCMFDRMINENIRPNGVSFIGVLSACSHAGLVEEGFFYFNSMSRFGIEPEKEHYGCMVSLLGRAGKLGEAVDLIGKMGTQPEATVWGSLVSACRDGENIEVGKYAAEMAICLDPKDSGSYILLSNLFASKCMWTDAKRVRERMEKNGVVKETGYSWIEIKNDVHFFISRDGSHPQTHAIYTLIGFLILQMKGLAYVPDVATLADE
nr:pentatricopeptide repeat-containing protein At4g39530 [Ipomoea batatas]